VKAGDIDEPFVTRSIFVETQSSRSMQETYGSDMTGFSAGGFVWTGTMTVNIFCP
jgi:hypothetical protein